MGQIKTFGQVDERSLDQLKRCMEAGDADFGVLCADHHPGYSQPIGGGIAYEGYVSPSGVGYDIGCIAAGARVTTGDGYFVPIEDVRAANPALCWDGRALRRIAPLLGAVERGVKRTLVVRLANGRVLTLTPDHEVRTKLGWKRADRLSTEDVVACSPGVGLPYESARGAISVAAPARSTELAARGLWPLSIDDARLPALLRLLGYASGDGHLTRDGKSVSIFVFDPADARDVVVDFERLGFRPAVYTRRRGPSMRPEIHVRANSVALHALFASLGSPIGKKAWSRDPMPWLLELPA